MEDYGVSVHSQWLVDNERNLPDWGIKIDNRLTDSPREVHKRHFREAHRNYREIPKYDEEKPVEVDWSKKHERSRR